MIIRTLCSHSHILNTFAKKPKILQDDSSRDSEFQYCHFLCCALSLPASGSRKTVPGGTSLSCSALIYSVTTEFGLQDRPYQKTYHCRFWRCVVQAPLSLVCRTDCHRKHITVASGPVLCQSPLSLVSRGEFARRRVTVTSGPVLFSHH